MPTLLEDMAKVSSTPLDTKSGEWEIKALDDSGQFKAYFAAFGNIDRGGDIIDPGAFKNLDEFQKDGWIGVNHQMDLLPVAYPTRVTQDSKGLLIEGRFHTTPEAQACRTVVKERMAAGKSVKGSIGYRTSNTKQEFRDGRSIRRLPADSTDLYEASFVNLPMNPAADAVSAKSLLEEGGQDVDEKVLTIEALKTWLDVQAKSGRALSKRNHATIKAWHGTLSTMCNDMKSLVDTHDPDKDPGNEPDNDGDEKDVDPNRSAGNSIPGDQGIGGAATAQNRKTSEVEEARARIQRNLDDMRARAVRVQTQFALMQ